MTDVAIAPATRSIIVDEVFPHAPELIWKAITSGDLMSRWLMKPEGFAPVEGTQFTYQTRAAGSWDGVIHCRVHDVTPNARLSYSWRGGHRDNIGYGAPLETVVTFTLERVDQGTRLRLEHTGFQLPRNQTAFDNMSPGWGKALQTIADLAGGLH